MLPAHRAGLQLMNTLSPPYQQQVQEKPAPHQLLPILSLLPHSLSTVYCHRNLVFSEKQAQKSPAGTELKHG